ncbi:hypothetical protein GQ607_013141 [Colletotrichum asianum]|uniref:Uncharacterized protein n=1 Tax=Colletotrichum asianum TaxID=702518 RepID=A0A8H3ZMX2_9PEZI|nr:hypothetical protein GQ607_013141 [Colletotrichum asianum]
MESYKIKSRAIVDNIMQMDLSDDTTAHVMDASEPIHDETYMMMSPYVWVRTVMPRRLSDFIVHLDHLSPVLWNEVQLDNRDEKACIQILSVLRASRPLKNAHTELGASSPGLILVVVQSDMLRTTSIIRAAAERDKKALFEIDLLDLVDLVEEEGDDKLIVESRLELRLDSAARMGGLVLLQNFAPLVATRSYEEQQRCAEITKFIELLEAYPGPIVLCLEKHDPVDGKLRKLGPLYIEIDNAGQE